MIGKWFARRRQQRTARVLAYLADGQQHHTADLARRYGDSPAAIIATLAGLEQSGQVESGWIDGPYPRRRWYRKVDREAQPLGLAGFCPHGVGMLDQCDDCCPEEVTP